MNEQKEKGIAPGVPVTERELYAMMNENDSDADLPKAIDVTGVYLCPGHPKICLGSGEFPGFECCCDECGYYTKCFPEWAPGGSAWKEDNENAGH